jgi:hypothetical protein
MEFALLGPFIYSARRSAGMQPFGTEVSQTKKTCPVSTCWPFWDLLSASLLDEKDYKSPPRFL